MKLFSVKTLLAFSLSLSASSAVFAAEADLNLNPSLNPNLASVVNGDTYVNSSIGQIGFIKLVSTDIHTQTIRLDWGQLNSGRNYHQLWSCSQRNAPCVILEDSEGYAKSLMILSDGSLVYNNEQHESTAFLPLSRVKR